MQSLDNIDLRINYHQPRPAQKSFQRCALQLFGQVQPGQFGPFRRIFSTFINKLIIPTTE